MDAPPSYESVTGNSARHPSRNGIPPERRRSMEDELRPLPDGWVRQFDAKSQHQFFVDTTKEPPRSIWQHPYDDDEYLATLSAEERQNLTRLTHSVSLKDIEAESSDDDRSIKKGAAGASSSPHAKRGETSAAAAAAASSSGSSSAAATAGPSDPHQPKGLKKFGRKLKDSLTNSTHEERERERQLRAEQEQQAYAMHLAYRNALSRAIETGQPQFLGKNRNGEEIFIEPPDGPYLPRGAVGYNPYAHGPYMNPNARFVRPEVPYGRPYGYGYGGGLGMPLMGGLLGGALLGGLLF
jgi:hypothetical protein